MSSKYDPALYETAFYDIELRLFRNAASGSYQVALRTWLDDEVFQELAPPPPELIHRTAETMACRTYGEMLYGWLFQGRIKEAFERARWSSTSRSSFSPVSPAGGTRFLVALAKDLPPEIVSMRWEALHVPDGYLPLSMSTAFSRLIRVRARSSAPLPPTPVRMLQVLADPAGLQSLGLPGLDSSLRESTDRVIERPWGQSVDLDRLGPVATVDQVRATVQKGYHVVYVAAHALSDEKEMRLVLADASGRATPISEGMWVDCLAPADGPAPGLVFLATPAPTFFSDGQRLSSVTARLLQAGVRHVITLQGPVTSNPLARFTESFLNSLLQTGPVDVAVATARFEMLDPDRSSTWEWTYPVLGLRTHGPSLVTAA